MVKLIFYHNARGFASELLIEEYADGERTMRFRYKHHDCRPHNAALADYNVGLTFAGFLRAINIPLNTADDIIRCANMWENYTDFCNMNLCIQVDDFIYTILNKPILPNENIQKTMVNISNIPVLLDPVGLHFDIE